MAPSSPSPQTSAWRPRLSAALRNTWTITIVGGTAAILAGTAFDALWPQIPWWFRQLPTVVPVSIHIDRPAKHDVVDGAPAITGVVRGLHPGELVWSFNQPTRSPRVYPDLGPCSVDGESFTCRLTSLTLDEQHAVAGQQDFTLWVAVVDTAQAVKYTETKARYGGAAEFVAVGVTGPEHVESAIDSVDVSCDKSCPASPGTPSAPSPTPSQGSSSSSPTSAASVDITSPTAGQGVAGTGVVVTGSAAGLGPDRLWLFVQSQGIYYRTNDVPVPLDGTSWAQGVTQFGVPKGRHQRHFRHFCLACRRSL